MKNLSVILSALALAGVIVLFLMRGKSGDTTAAGNTPAVAAGISTGRIAYVNLDTFNAKYDYLKSKREDFEKKQEGMKAELERSAKQFQNDAVAYQRKVQAGTISEAEAQATEKRLMQMQQSYKTREEALTGQLLDEQDAFNKELKQKLDSYLEEYNKDKKYDFILSYSAGSPIIYANKALDITEDVLKGMNSAAKSGDADKKNK